VDSPIAAARAAAGLEPLFGPMGDRKLDLLKLPEDGDFHSYHFVDQDGKIVGALEILPDEAKKQLYVMNINGLAGLYSNSFGPSSIRDIKRQLKSLYPEYETVTGHRVSGARYSKGYIDSRAKELAASDGKVWEELDQLNQDVYRAVASETSESATDHPVVKLGPAGWDEVGGKDDWMAFREIFERKFREGNAGFISDKYSIHKTENGDVLYLGRGWNPATESMEPMVEPLGQARPLMETFREKFQESGVDVKSPEGAAANAMAVVAERNGLSGLRTYYTNHPDSYFAGSGGLYNPYDPAILIRGQGRL